MRHGASHDTSFDEFVVGGGGPGDQAIGDDEKERLYRLAEHIHAIRATRDVPVSHDNPSIPAGYTYFGQLVAHDLTFHDIRPSAFADTTPSEEFPRAATLDLDCIYGGGPEVSPWLYEPEPDANAPRFRLGLGQSRFKDDCERRTGRLDDVPRIRCPMHDSSAHDGSHGRRARHDPLVADPRNDQHLLISQLVVLFCKFHNIVAERVRAHHRGAGPTAGRWSDTMVFPRARALVTSVYGRIVAGDFLKRLLCPDVYRRYADIYHNARYDRFRLISLSPENPRFAVPPEFWLAAFRAGHGMVQNRYNVSSAHNLDRDNARELGIANLLKLAGPASFETPVTAEWVVEWDRFFFEPGEIEGNRRRDNGRLVNFSHRIEPTAAAGLGVATGRFKTEDGKRTLLYRDFARGLQNRLPSAQDYIRAHVGLLEAGDGPVAGPAMLRPDQLRPWLAPEMTVLSELTGGDIDAIVAETPLLFYLLCESAAPPRDGRCLGPLGSTIVAEVIFGALLASRGQASPEQWQSLFRDDAPATMNQLVRFVERHWTARRRPGVCECAAD